MAQYLGDINTRARGLRTHLLPASDLERLARATSLFVLQRELSGLGYLRSDTPATAMSLEKAIRRHAAAQMTILERWCTDDRRTILAVIFEDEDRRSIQAILRGAQQGTATEARMAGLVPTRSLPERALRPPSITLRNRNRASARVCAQGVGTRSPGRKPTSGIRQTGR